MEEKLIKCAMELADKWKQCFGLYTQYAGYLTADMALAIMTVWRDWDGEMDLEEYEPEELQRVINDRIFDFNENNPQNKLPFFSLHKEETVVLPKLLSVLDKYDLWVDNTTWDNFADYLRKRAAKR